MRIFVVVEVVKITFYALGGRSIGRVLMFFMPLFTHSNGATSAGKLGSLRSVAFFFLRLSIQYLLASW